MKQTLLVFLLSCLLSFPSHTAEKKEFQSKLQKDFRKLAIKGGLGLGHIRLKRDKTEDKFVTPTINTQLSVYMGDLELSASAHMSFGKINELDYDLEDEIITGVGHVLDLSLSPILKYKTNSALDDGRWPIYLGAGPSWSLYSISFDDNEQVMNKDYNIDTNEFKLSYNTFGYNFVIGVEERTDSKSLHPVYIEFMYSYRKSRKLTLVDTEQFEEIEIAYVQDDSSFEYHSIMLSMGITFF